MKANGASSSIVDSRDGPPPHSPAEDLHALALGSSLAAFGLVMLKAAGLVTGGVAGMALILSYRTGIQVGVLFVVLNVPFFLLARQRMGWTFTMKSFATMIALAAFAAAMPGWLRLLSVEPAFAALFGGSLIGMGMLSLARHRASVGGISILALYLQERRGWSAGLVQMTVDMMVVAASIVVIDVRSLGYSALSAFAQSLLVVIYHRPGRYAVT
ncbi:YitT family protein [Sphingomonas sp. LB2R24]|uniref:YitT family protein n=1 Tax=Sphingomonas sorbitolis TaxID=3096165 RepID=UPI002FC713F5